MHVIYGVNQEEYVMHIRVAASPECVNRSGPTHTHATECHTHATECVFNPWAADAPRALAACARLEPPPVLRRAGGQRV